MIGIIDYRSGICIKDKLGRLLDYCDRMEKEEPFTDAEMIGRLFTIYGTTEMAAEELACMEEEARKTLLCHTQLDYERWIAKIEARCRLLKKTLGYVPIFAERNRLAYPLLEEDDTPEAKEKLKSMENLPHNNRAKKTMVDVTEAAYYMHDLIFINMGRILNSLQNLYDDKRMLKESDDKCSQRYNQMMIDYQENEGVMDQPHFLKELDDFIGQNGDSKEALKAFLSRLEHEALNHPKHGKVAIINHHFLNQNSHVSYIFHSRHHLTQDEINRHLYFVCCWNHVNKKIELCILKEPAAGAEADLFTCRAAKELAEQLIPVIKDRVVFHYSYQYAAWVKALMDLKMIYPNKGEQNKRNGTLIVNYIYKMFGERIDKSTLFSYISKDEEFSKIRDQYDLIISLYEQTFDERIELLRKMV